jgi:hypothetical protein
MEESETPQHAILRLTHANVHLARGMAHAVAIGFENFARKLAHENVLDPDLNKNGFVAGVVAGWTAALTEGAKLTEQAFNIWQGIERGGGSPVKPPKTSKNKAARPEAD